MTSKSTQNTSIRKLTTMHGLDSSSGRSVAKLDEITSMSNNISNTKINTMDNFSEIYAKPFNLTITENTYVPDQVTGT